MVILCDFKLRKFQRRLMTPGEQLVPKMSSIENAIYRSRVRLNAALARSRIKSQVLSIDWLLPDSVRKNDTIGAKMHVSCWVNGLKSRYFICPYIYIYIYIFLNHIMSCSVVLRITLCGNRKLSQSPYDTGRVAFFALQFYYATDFVHPKLPFYYACY